MLKTLIAIGNQLGKEMDEWDDLINQVEVEKTTGKDNIPLNNYVAEMVFDLDVKDVYVSPALRAYEDRSPKFWRNIKITERNGKSTFSCVLVRKNLDQYRKTFFGKFGKGDKGEFVQAIEARQPQLVGSKLYQALEEVYSLKAVFDEKYFDMTKESVSPEKLWTGLNLGKTDRIILLSASVKSDKLGIAQPTPIKDLTGFEQFFLPPKKEEKTAESAPKLCYATGEMLTDVGKPEFANRYSINKMFVTTTMNYAAHLDSSAFHENYQVSGKVQTALERGSNHILESLTTKIAGVGHCIIPEFLPFEPVPEVTQLKKLKRRCDLLFQNEDWVSLTDDIGYDLDSAYWITFQGFQSDGNYFKTTNLIKSVSKHHLNKLIEAFRKLHYDWNNQQDFPWDEVTARSKGFNLRSIYGVIPVRKDLIKNQALSFFKSLLENRKVEKQQLFGFFNELILCYWYKRFKAYANIYPNEYFDFAARDAVFKYLAIFQILKQFKLIKGMENNNQSPPPDVSVPEKTDDLQERIERFFARMEYDDNQKAMFYLGRALSSVAYAQTQKEHSSKPILNKLNFNGIGVKEIERLRLDLTEKTQQYRIHGFTEPLFEKFNHYFKHNEWNMPPQEALFFLLSGYSFSVSSKKSPSKTSTSNQ